MVYKMVFVKVVALDKHLLVSLLVIQLSEKGRVLKKEIWKDQK